MKKKIFSFSILGIFVISVALWGIGKGLGPDKFNFNTWHMFALFLGGAGILYILSAILSKIGMYNILGGIMLFLGVLFLCIGCHFVWWLYMVLLALTVALVIAVRVIFNIKKWDTATGHIENKDTKKE